MPRGRTQSIVIAVTLVPGFIPIAVLGLRMLKPETVSLLQAEQQLASGAGSGYGLGRDIETDSILGQATRVGDQLVGGVSSLVTLPKNDIVVSVISNMSYANAHDVALKIAEAFISGKP
ncbi:MAG: hypothetical protein ACKOEC_09495 [Acidimicrobiia bacterium]